MRTVRSNDASAYRKVLGSDNFLPGPGGLNHQVGTLFVDRPTKAVNLFRLLVSPISRTDARVLWVESRRLVVEVEK